MKRMVLSVIVLMLIISVGAGCSIGSPNITEGPQTDIQETPNLNKQGYPIVNEKINLDVVVAASTTYEDFNVMPIWKEIEEITNIHLDFEVISSNVTEKINLIFASQDYPDLMFNGPNDRQIMNAASAGDIAPLNSLIEEYAPNWYTFFQEDDFSRRLATTMPDSKIWSLPLIRMEEFDYGVRDQWMIHVGWLNELGLQMPKTTDDFYEYLKAVKTNAGKGSIPENVIPWIFRYNAYTNGGQYELYNAFGVFTPGNPNYISVGEQGEVVFSAINPKIKEPIKYLNKLYQEGLIPPEVFTDDDKTQYAKIISDPPIVASYLRYSNRDLTEEIYDVLPPLAAPGVEKPTFRRQTNSVQRNKFTIFTKNQYPEASIRLANLLAEKEWSLQAFYGLYGDSLEKGSDGKITQKPTEAGTKSPNPGVLVSLLVTPDTVKDLQYGGSQAQRGKNIEEIYKPFVAPLERFYPPAVWTEEETAQLQDIQTDLLQYIDKTIAHWIVDGGCDTEWDGYIKQINNLKLDEFLQIYQTKLDDVNKN